MKRQYHLFDANNKVLGRLSTEIVGILMGKNNVDYAPHIDGGDAVVVINAQKVKLTGTKEKNKKYYNYTGFAGNMKEVSAGEMREKNAAEIIRRSVVGMLPKNKLGSNMQKRLFIYNNNEYSEKIDITHE